MMETKTEPKERRSFLKKLLIAPALFSTSLTYGETEKSFVSPLKLSLNAYSFNDLLLGNKMSLEELLQFCYDEGIGAVDITAYYFQGYPLVPSDEVLFQFKRKALQLGIEISGTGVRNDFTDQTKQNEQVQVVKNWIVAASKIGAPVIRIFSGNRNPNGAEREAMQLQVISAVKECVEFGKQQGVVVAVQNHNDFIQTADQALDFIRQVNSDWFGLVVDAGSFRQSDPYLETAKTAKYAVNWQIKEKVFVNGVEVDTDINRLIKIVIDSGYKGYIPIETLGKGDPKLKVIAWVAKVRKALESYHN